MGKYKIAIIGTENSHAWTFAEMIQQGMFPELELIGAFGPDSQANDKMKKLGTPYIAADPMEFLDGVDGAVFTSRHGNDHYRYALPYIKKGIPSFIDKPFCVQEENAWEMAALAKENGTLLCGGSCFEFDENIKKLRAVVENHSVGEICGGTFTAPANLQNEYGGFFFYTQHLIQMLLGVFGSDVRSVIARGDEKRVSAICRYDAFDVSCLYYDSYRYSAAVYGTERIEFYECGKDYPSVFRAELQEFLTMLQTRRMPKSYFDLIAPVFLLHAIYKAYMQGEEVQINWPERI